jgi:hypothetical protein
MFLYPVCYTERRPVCDQKIKYVSVDTSIDDSAFFSMASIASYLNLKRNSLPGVLVETILPSIANIEVLQTSLLWRLWISIGTEYRSPFQLAPCCEV